MESVKLQLGNTKSEGMTKKAVGMNFDALAVGTEKNRTNRKGTLSISYTRGKGGAIQPKIILGNRPIQNRNPSVELPDSGDFVGSHFFSVSMFTGLRPPDRYAMDRT